MGPLQGCLVHNPPPRPLGSYGGPMPRALGWSWGWGSFVLASHAVGLTPNTGDVPLETAGTPILNVGVRLTKWDSSALEWLQRQGKTFKCHF